MKILLVSVVLLFVCACGSSTQRTSTGSNRNVITEQEIQGSTASNAYELIRMKRPQFLRAQGPKSFGGVSSSTRLPVVYVNGLRFGYPEDLMKLPAEDVKEVRYLNEQDANLQFGIGHVAGAILVTTKR